MEVVALIILTLFSVVGFAAIFFTTFGTLIIFIGAILYSLLTGFSQLSWQHLLIILVLYLCGEAMEYVCVIFGAKQFGASNKAAFGALVGGIIGAIIGVSFFGVGIVFGTFLGIFLGAFAVEYFVQKDLMQSLKAGSGGVIGRIGSIVAKVVIATIMLTIIISNVLNR